MKKYLVYFSLDHPKLVIAITGALTVLLLFQFPKVRIDTDPENMLNHDEQVRLDHQDMKETFDLNDMIVLGIYNERGIFDAETIARILDLTEAIKDIDGVLADDILAIGEVDDIASENDMIRVYPLAELVSGSAASIGRLKERIDSNPIFRNKLTSYDGTLAGIYVPIQEKSLSFAISQEIETLAERHLQNVEFYIAGLPVAENTFGSEMFKQMGVTAPLSGLVIMLLMFLFFKKGTFIIGPMILALVTIVWTMGLLIGMGFTVHIMSSMIPIFLFPIAVLDSIHILSDIYEKHSKTSTIKETISRTIDDLFSAMLFTSLTSFIGFVSLTLTPIPPVQVFGFFVGIGILSAWLLSMTFLPAYTVLLPERTFQNFGTAAKRKKTIIDTVLRLVQKWSLQMARPIIAGIVLLVIISVVGISKIVVNDNPVNWFKPGHPLRKADTLMNDHLGGTYMSNLVFKGEEDAFKNPEVVNYVADVQFLISGQPEVGATSSVVDIVKKIGYELKGVDSIPQTPEEIGQFYFLYEIAGGDPDDLFTFVTSDFDQAQIWVQMTNGDNLTMKNVVDRVADYVSQNPPPDNISLTWAGLNYINVVWQDKMVNGMVLSLMGGILGVFIMMVLLFRSFLWALLSMIPLATTITGIYALIGFTGKAYDMPVAVLSTLTLGLSIDFAIHFIRRAQMIHKNTNDFNETMNQVFQEPAKAIVINMVIVAFGFLPLLGSNLVPYITVGAFLFLIMITSGIATLVMLPALLKVTQKRLFPQ
jgi:predicted RND superfamily exporter protein